MLDITLRCHLIGRILCYDHIMSMLELYDGGANVRCASDLITFSTVLNVLGRGLRESDSSSGSSSSSNGG